MDLTQWIILGLAVSAVLVVYLYTRRNDGPNPWREMDDGSDELPVDTSEEAKGPDVIVDPSVADEWEGFKPERDVNPAGNETAELETIRPAKLKASQGAGETSKTATRQAGGHPQNQPQPAKSPAATKAEGDDVDQKIVVLHVVGREQTTLSGPQIHQALQHSQLQFGERAVYHRLADVGGQGISVFSVANMLKPGSLDPEQAADLHTPGLVMFMLLPGPVDGNKAFQDMLHTAQELASQLNGMVLDDKRLPLTRQAAQYLIDDIAKLEHRRRLANA